MRSASGIEHVGVGGSIGYTRRGSARITGNVCERQQFTINGDVDYAVFRTRWTVDWAGLSKNINEIIEPTDRKRIDRICQRKSDLKNSLTITRTRWAYIGAI